MARDAAAQVIQQDVLVGPVRSHGDEGRAEKAGKNGVLDRKHADDFLPAVFRRIEPGREEIVPMKTACPRDDLIPSAGHSGHNDGE